MLFYRRNMCKSMLPAVPASLLLIGVSGIMLNPLYFFASMDDGTEIDKTGIYNSINRRTVTVGDNKAVGRTAEAVKRSGFPLDFYGVLWYNHR